MLPPWLSAMLFPLYPDFTLGLIGAAVFLVGLIFLLFSRKSSRVIIVRARRVTGILMVAYLLMVPFARLPRADVLGAENSPFGEVPVKSQGFPLRVFTDDAGMTDPRVHEWSIVVNYLFFILVVGALVSGVWSKKRKGASS